VLAATAVLGTLAFSAIWGLAVGSTSASMALSSAYKVPLVILLAGIASFPAAFLALRLLGAELRARDLFLRFAAAMFTGSLILAVLAPIVAIYYHTSISFGVPLALGSAIAALAIAGLLFARAAIRRAVSTGGWGRSITGVVVLVGLYSLALLQIVAIASPIISATTAFDSGVDGWLR